MKLNNKNYSSTGSKLRILYVSLDTRLNEFNAQYSHTFSLAKHLSTRNKLFLIMGGDENRITKILNFKVLITKFNPPVYENSFFKLIRLIYNHINVSFRIRSVWQGYDVIYERCRIGMFTGLIFSKIFRIPLVYELNGILDEEMYEVGNINNKFLQNIISKLFKTQLKGAHATIVQTNELKKAIEKKVGINNVFVVENGVEHIGLSIKRNYDKTTKLVFVGNLNKSHNLGEIFESITKIQDKFRLLVIGGGDYKEAYVKKFSGDKRFIFLGNLPHERALELIIDSDICIASYFQQYTTFKKYGFYFCPLKLLEYSAAGKPTIIYGLSNSFTKIFEKENACIVVKSKEEFLRKLKFLEKDKELVKKMGENAKRIANKFTWDKSAIRTEKVLRYAIKNK